MFSAKVMKLLGQLTSMTVYNQLSTAVKPVMNMNDDLLYLTDTDKFYTYDGTDYVLMTDNMFVEWCREQKLKQTLNARLTKCARLYTLGAPVVADVDRIVVSTNIKVGAYTIAAQPDVPRNITVKVVAVGTADTMGTVKISGTNYAGVPISEIITPVAGSTVAGIKAFKTVTSVIGAGWVKDAVEATNDTIEVGVGTVLGLPIALSATTQIPLGIFDKTIIAHNPVIAATPSICETTVDLSAGTYNGTKIEYAFVVD